MNRQENSHPTGVSCFLKMKSLIENNGSVLRQIAQRKRRMRERAFREGTCVGSFTTAGMKIRNLTARILYVVIL